MFWWYNISSKFWPNVHKKLLNPFAISCLLVISMPSSMKFVEKEFDLHLLFMTSFNIFQVLLISFLCNSNDLY